MLLDFSFFETIANNDFISNLKQKLNEFVTKLNKVNSFSGKFFLSINLFFSKLTNYSFLIDYSPHTTRLNVSKTTIALVETTDPSVTMTLSLEVFL